MLKDVSGGRLINLANENNSLSGQVFKWQPENCSSVVTFTCSFRVNLFAKAKGTAIINSVVLHYKQNSLPYDISTLRVNEQGICT